MVLPVKSLAGLFFIVFTELNKKKLKTPAIAVTGVKLTYGAYYVSY